MIKAIIFDFDGVIVESVDIKTRAFAKLFESESQDVVEEIVSYHLQRTGVSRFEKFQYIYKNILSRVLTKKTFDGLCQNFSKLVVDEVIRAPFVKGAKEFLDNYATRYKCFIISATPQDEIEDIIKQRQLTHYFNRIYGAPKKKIGAVKEIINDNKLKPEELFYIGDALSDYEAASANSVNFIAKVDSNDRIFKDISCIRVKTLENLKDILKDS